MDINHNEIPTNEIAYYIKNKRSMPEVCWGVVIENYPSCVALQLYELKDNRVVNGVPVKELPLASDFQKLPNDWTWGSSLFEIQFIPRPAFVNAIRVCNKKSLLKGISDGYLVKVQDNDNCLLESEVTKEGWRIVKKYPATRIKQTIVSVSWENVYDTYESACEAASDFYNEIKRQRSLSDKEWSIEQIDKTVNQWSELYGIPNNRKSIVRNWLANLPSVESVEARCVAGEVQWKYTNNKRWKAVEI